MFSLGEHATKQLLLCLADVLYVIFLIKFQSSVLDQEGILSLHLCLGFPRPLLPSTMPSKQSLEKPTDDLFKCPKSFRVLLLIVSKRGGNDVWLRRVEILIFSINLCPVMKRMT